MKTSVATSPPSPVFVRIAAVLLVVAVAMAWSNSLRSPFVFDDIATVLENDSIRSWRTVLLPPTTGMPVTGRPVANLTFALDRAVYGVHARGFHVTNIALHAAASLLLLGLVHRTLRRVPMFAVGSAHGVETPALIAAASALLWSLHPLQTASVTYIAQRTEILAALFVLLALFAFVHSVDAPHANRWRAASVVACALAMASKETAAATPLLILLYDRAFVTGTFHEAWRKRWPYYLALASCWLLLAGLVASSPGRGGSAGFGSPVPWFEYALTQTRAIVHYLRLAVWPHPLVFDYGRPIIPDARAVWPELIVLAAMLAATTIALVRRLRLGFLGAAFFLLLAPSSSVIPVATQTMAEHRIYLPLATIIVGVVAAVGTRWPLPAGLCASMVAFACGVGTWSRNDVYRDEVSLWTHTARHAPENARAHFNLGRALVLAGRPIEARRALDETLRLDPNHARAHDALGLLLASEGNDAGALRHFNRALELEPRFPAARVNRGALLDRNGRVDEAIADYRVALEVEPAAFDARLNLGEALSRVGRTAEANEQLELLRRQNATPAHVAQRAARALAQTHASLGMSEARAGRWDAAATRFEEALRVDPRFAEAHANLGNVRLQQGRARDAIAHYERALDLRPDMPGVRENLALAQAALAGHEP